MEVSRHIAHHLSQATQAKTTYSFIFGEQILHAHIHLIPTLPDFTNRLWEHFQGLRQPTLTPDQAQEIQTILKL